MDPSKFSKTIQPLFSMILDLPPSCIEFIPGFPEFFVAGTYNLQKEVDTGSLPQSRTGSLNLLRIVEDESSLIQTLSHPSAILDLHFLPDSVKFGVASSTGTISIYQFQDKAQQISLIATHQAFDPAILVLSFTWNPLASLECNPLFAATLSNGSIHLLHFSSDFKLLEILKDSEPINKHTLEAWTCTFAHAPAGSSVRIYSGGDDGMLRRAEMESIPSPTESDVPIVHEFKGHEAGVTALLPLLIMKPPEQTGILDDLMLTGSYDDCVRVYSASNTRGKVLAELKIGGGVWRLKFLDPSPPLPQQHDSEVVKFRVLASCMHAGARILEVKREGTDGEWKIEILGSVTVHESMCYGSDVQPVECAAGDEDGKRLCVSTSFYDRLVCLWRFDPDAA